MQQIGINLFIDLAATEWTQGDNPKHYQIHPIVYHHKENEWREVGYWDIDKKKPVFEEEYEVEMKNRMRSYEEQQKQKK